MNHFTSTHAGSRFRRNLMVARPTLTARHAIGNREYVVRHADGRTNRTPLTDDDMPAVLRDVFGLAIDDTRGFLAWNQNAP
jgi:N-hydroxyarylamine O-acetyltransferase